MLDSQNATAQPAEGTEEQETKLLQALLKKGPALPVELAVRTFSYLEEIATPLAALEEQGYIERQKLRKGEMFVLTRKGQERAQEK